MLRPPCKRQSLTKRQRIEYGGYHREIISRNPPLVDEDGYEVDSEDDDERAEAAIAAAAEMDPYSSIHIERMNPKPTP